jgi:hypothetical protein
MSGMNVGEMLAVRCVSGQEDHGEAFTNQQLGNMSTDKACSSGNDNLHDPAPIEFSPKQIPNFQQATVLLFA